MSDDPFADTDESTENEEVESNYDKSPEEAGVPKGAQYQSSALTPVVDSEGHPTNFPPITNKDAAPWDPDIPGPSEPQVYGRANIEAHKERSENAYSGKGVPDYQLGTLHDIEEGQTTAHLGGLHDKDGNALNADGTMAGEPAPEGNPEYQVDPDTQTVPNDPGE